MLHLIGISGRPDSGKTSTAEIITSLYPKFETKKFTGYIEEITCHITGIPVEDLEKEEVKNSYLPAEWSYIREERFVDHSGINRKPVRYYLTPAAIMKRLDIEVCRQVHSNFLVNALFVNYRPEDYWVIKDVWFPAEAEAIKDKGGILIRTQRRGEGKNARSNEYPLEKWPFDYTIDTNGSPNELKQKIEKILSDLK